MEHVDLGKYAPTNKERSEEDAIPDIFIRTLDPVGIRKSDRYTWK